MFSSMRKVLAMFEKQRAWCGLLSIPVLALGAGCGGTSPPPAEPELVVMEPEAPPPMEPESPEAVDEEAAAENPRKEEENQPEPEFKEGMSVQEAMDAVPQGMPRLNIDDDRLSEPLRDPALYEPCKLRGSDHFKLRVAVWRGKAVGIDLSTAPKNPRLEECLKQQLQAVVWQDKVRSLNTVEYAY